MKIKKIDIVSFILAIIEYISSICKIFIIIFVIALIQILFTSNNTIRNIAFSILILLLIIVIIAILKRYFYEKFPELKEPEIGDKTFLQKYWWDL